MGYLRLLLLIVTLLHLLSTLHLVVIMHLSLILVRSEVWSLLGYHWGSLLITDLMLLTKLLLLLSLIVHLRWIVWICMLNLLIRISLIEILMRKSPLLLTPILLIKLTLLRIKVWILIYVTVQMRKLSAWLALESLKTLISSSLIWLMGKTWFIWWGILLTALTLV